MTAITTTTLTCPECGTTHLEIAEGRVAQRDLLLVRPSTPASWPLTRGVIANLGPTHAQTHPRSRSASFSRTVQRQLRSGTRATIALLG